MLCIDPMPRSDYGTLQQRERGRAMLNAGRLVTAMVTLAAVFEVGLSLPGVEERLAYGSPALKVKGRGAGMQLMACVPTHKSAEPNSLMIRVDQDQRAVLLAESPDVYYAPEHYVNYDAVLVRLSRLDPGMLRDVLTMARNAAAKKSGR